MKTVASWLAAAVACAVLVWWMSSEPARLQRDTAENRRKYCPGTEAGFTVRPAEPVEFRLRTDCWSGVVRYEYPKGRKWNYKIECNHAYGSWCDVLFSDGAVHRTGGGYPMPTPPEIQVIGHGSFRTYLWSDADGQPPEGWGVRTVDLGIIDCERPYSSAYGELRKERVVKMVVPPKGCWTSWYQFHAGSKTLDVKVDSPIELAWLYIDEWNSMARKTGMHNNDHPVLAPKNASRLRFRNGGTKAVAVEIHFW